jgi:hypothetical protein
LGGAPIASVGLFLPECGSSTSALTAGAVYLDSLTWDGAPNVAFHRAPGQMWKRQWVNAADFFADEFGEAFRVVQNRGRGLVITGAREWTNYCVQAVITPHLASAFGLAARVQGQERYYALLLAGENTVNLVKRLDGERLLAEQPLAWQLGQPYALRLDVQGHQIRAWVDGVMLFTVDDAVCPLSSGGIALVCEAGRVGTDKVSISPVY